MSRPKRIPKKKPAPCWVPCECGLKTITTLIPGANDVHIVCDCSAIIHIVVNYDGYGVATVQEGKIERVEA